MKLRIAQLAAATLVLAGGLLALGTKPAGAYTLTNSGCPGAIQTPTINGYYTFGPGFEFVQRYAWRSPCYSAYTQVISVRYRLWSYDFFAKQWVYYAETTRSANVAAGYGG